MRELEGWRVWRIVDCELVSPLALASPRPLTLEPGLYEAQCAMLQRDPPAHDASACGCGLYFFPEPEGKQRAIWCAVFVTTILAKASVVLTKVRAGGYVMASPEDPRERRAQRLRVLEVLVPRDLAHLTAQLGTSCAARTGLVDLPESRVELFDDLSVARVVARFRALGRAELLSGKLLARANRIAAAS